VGKRMKSRKLLRNHASVANKKRGTREEEVTIKSKMSKKREFDVSVCLLIDIFLPSKKYLTLRSI
jgi:hypothetical protein